MPDKLKESPEACFPPAQWVCATNGPVNCVCEVRPVYSPPPGPSCTVSVVYGVNIPTLPQLAPVELHCDAAGVELALAVILAKLLAGMPVR